MHTVAVDRKSYEGMKSYTPVDPDPYVFHAHELGLDPLQVYEAPNGERATGREIAKQHYYRLHWKTPVHLDIITLKKVSSS